MMKALKRTVFSFFDLQSSVHLYYYDVEWFLVVFTNTCFLFLKLPNYVSSSSNFLFSELDSDISLPDNELSDDELSELSLTE